MESLIAFKRAGADEVLIHFAPRCSKPERAGASTNTTFRLCYYAAVADGQRTRYGGAELNGVVRH
jgi:hypothetical protein